MKPMMFTTQMKSISVATYGNQRPIAFVGQPLLGDLRLRDLVDLLAERLATARLLGPHQRDAEQDRQRGADHQVDDGLRDREVQRAEVDRDPLVLLELRRRVERRRARMAAGGAASARTTRIPRRFIARLPMYVTIERPSSNV